MLRAQWRAADPRALQLQDGEGGRAAYVFRVYVFRRCAKHNPHRKRARQQRKTRAEHCQRHLPALAFAGVTDADAIPVKDSKKR